MIILEGPLEVEWLQEEIAAAWGLAESYYEDAERAVAAGQSWEDRARVLEMELEGIILSLAL